MELLKDGAAGGGDRRHSGANGPGGQRGEGEGDDSSEWNGVGSLYHSGQQTLSHGFKNEGIINVELCQLSFHREWAMKRDASALMFP